MARFSASLSRIVVNLAVYLIVPCMQRPSSDPSRSTVRPKYFHSHALSSTRERQCVREPKLITIAHLELISFVYCWHYLASFSFFPSGSRPLLFHPHFNLNQNQTIGSTLRDNPRRCPCDCLQRRVFFQPRVHFIPEKKGHASLHVSDDVRRFIRVALQFCRRTQHDLPHFTYSTT